ncbi:LolA family protein [Pirellulaceae bacterium SH501]
MASQDLKYGEKILEVAIQNFRLQTVPDFPNPKVEFPSTREHLHKDNSKPSLINKLGGAILKRRSLPLAVAVCTVIAGFFAIWPWESANQRAVAQLQEVVHSLNSLVFELKSHSGDQVTGQFKITYAKPGNARMDSALAVHIFNATNAEYTIVDDAKRSVTIQPVYDATAVQNQLAGPLVALLNLEPLPSTKMRTLTVDGKLAKELKTVWDGSSATVLVDARTNLPIKIELDRGTSENGKQIRDVATNFQFNINLDSSCFTPNLPEGYEVSRIERHDTIRSSDHLVLITGSGIGPVRFGMTLQEVRNYFGDPDSFSSKPSLTAELDDNGKLKIPMRLVPADPPQMVGVMQYRSLGLQIELSSIDGVKWIRCYESKETWNRFTGMTSHGIKIGMSKQDVETLLEKDQSAIKDLRRVDNRWLLNGMDIVFENDKCVELSIGKSHFVKEQ